MKNIIICLFIIPSFTIFAQKHSKSHRAKEKAVPKTANIKSQSAFEYTFQMGQKLPDSSFLYIKKFNQKGNIVENNSPEEKIIFTYNDKGKLAEESFYDSLGKNIRYKDSYQYADNGMQSLKIEYGQNRHKIFSIASSYNSQKQEIERIVLDSIGKFQSKIKSTYDDKKNILNESELDSSGKSVTKKIYNYNSKSNLIGLTILKHDTIASKYLHEYDKLGKKTKTVCYNSDGTINYKTINNYNAKGMLSDETTYQGAGFSKTTYQYDAKGNITQELKSNEVNSILTKAVYHYNAKCLLTEEIQFNSFDEPESLIRYNYELFPVTK